MKNALDTPGYVPLEKFVEVEAEAARLSVAVTLTYRALSNVSSVHDHKHNAKWMNVALDHLREALSP